jgi:thioredoxin-related protein
MVLRNAWAIALALSFIGFHATAADDVASGTLQPAVSESKETKVYSWKDGLAEAKQKQLPIFVVLTQEGCHNCAGVMERVKTDAVIRPTLDQFVTVEIPSQDPEGRKWWTAHPNGGAAPLTYVLTSIGKTVATAQGTLPGDALPSLLKDGLQKVDAIAKSKPTLTAEELAAAQRAPTAFVPIKEGIAAARKAQSPLLVICAAEGCPVCADIKLRLENDDDVRAALADCVMSEIDYQSPDFKAWDKKFERPKAKDGPNGEKVATPMIFVVAPNGKAVISTCGPQDGNELIKLLKDGSEQVAKMKLLAASLNSPAGAAQSAAAKTPPVGSKPALTLAASDAAKDATNAEAAAGAAPTKFLAIKEAITAAKKSTSPLLVLCTLKGCHNCASVKAQLETNDDVKAALADYVIAEIDTDAPEFQPWVKQYPRRGRPVPGGEMIGTPYIYVIAPSGKAVVSTSGAKESNELVELLKEGSTKVAAMKAISANLSALASGKASGATKPSSDATDSATPAGKTAPAPAATLEKKAGSYLSMAKGMAKDQPEKAKAYAQKAIDTAPESPQAAEATELLKTLK